MFKKIKNVVMALALVSAMAVPALAIPGTVAAQGSIANNLCRGTNFAAGETGTNCQNEGGTNATLSDIATRIVNFLSIIVGIIAVIMIIVGGFRYITSGGESSNVSGAKNTLIYAIVGLIIVALAQFIVRFVLSQTSGIN